MTYTLPENWTNAKDAYNKIEMYGKKGGQYPIGKNHSWHSGVHIYGTGHINPMIEGTIVACRLADSFAAIPRLKNIMGESNLKKLSDLEQFLYKDPDGQEPSDHRYTLRYERISETTLNELETIKPGIKQWFEEKDGWYEPVEKVSSEFVLLKHRVDFPEHNNQRKTIEFFTLYMGIYTFIEELKEYYADFKAVPGSKIARVPPVFQEWVFRLKNTPAKPYKDCGSFKVFEYSTFSFALNPNYSLINDSNLVYDCTFANDPGEEKRSVPVPIECIVVTNGLYKPRRNNVAVYKIGRERPGRRMASIKENSKFTKVESWNDDYYKVVVWDGDCVENGYEPPILRGWVVLTQEQKRNTSGPFRLGTDQQAFNIARVDLPVSDGYFIVRTRDYHAVMGHSSQLMGLSLEQENRPLVIKRVSSENDDTLHTFYYRGERISQEMIDASKYDALFPRRITGRQDIERIFVYRWTLVQDFGPGDFAVIGNSNRPTYPYTHIIDNASFCRFTYPTNESELNALVLKADLRLHSGSGYLKSGFCDAQMNGCILYDSYTEGNIGNARECLGEQESGWFKSGNPYSLLEDFQDNKAYHAKHGEKKGYLFIDRGVTVEAKIEYKEGFQDRSLIITPNMETKQTDILGYPSPLPWEGAPFYDLALFFNDNGFLMDGQWNDYPYYVKPANFEELYEANASGALVKVNLNNNEHLKRERALGRPAGTKTVEAPGEAPKEYKEFRIHGKTYYIPWPKNGQPEGKIVKNYLKWPDWFIVMQTNDKPNTIICDHKQIVRAITEENLSFERLLAVYTTSSDAKKREKLRKLVCQHRLEWNRGLYDANFMKEIWGREEGERQSHLIAKMEKQDLRMNPGGGEAQGSELPPKGAVWFAHPVYFLDHIDKAGLLADEEHVQALIDVQDRVIKLRCLDPNGGTGIYNVAIPGVDFTPLGTHH